MINGLFGRPGGGKSYEALKYFILPSILKDKRKVVTNIPIIMDHFIKVHGEEYRELLVIVEGAYSKFGEVRPFAHPQDYLQYQEWRNELGQGVLFVIDEAHLALGQYTKKEVTEFLSLHRHYGFDIYLLTQNHAKINKDVRAMIENSYNCAKMEAYGQTGYNRKTFHGLPSRDFIAMEQREYDPSIFPYYKSHTASVGSVVEAKAKGGGAILNPYKKVTIVFITLGVFALIFVGSKVFSSDEKQIITKTLEKPVVMNNQNQINDLVLNEPISAELKKDIKPKIVTAPMSTSQEIFEEKRNNSEKYHPFRKVQLHVDGIYWDDEQSVRNVYFSASTNGQKMFDVTLKELILSGYTVNVLGDCIVELLYFDYQEFIMCDVPKVSTGQTNVAQN